VNYVSADPTYGLVLGDLGPALQRTLLVASGTATVGAPFPLNATTDSVTMNYIGADKVVRTVPMSIVDAPNGVVRRDWQIGDLPVVGPIQAQIVVARAGVADFPQTFPDAGANLTWTVSPAIGAANVPTTSFINDNAGAIVIGQLVYQTTAGHVDLATTADMAHATVIGLVAAASIASGASGVVQTSGPMILATPQWDAVTGQVGGLTPGAEYYLTGTGLLTKLMPVSPNAIVVPIGAAASTQQLNLAIQAPVQLAGPQLAAILGQSNATGHGDTFFTDQALALLSPYPIGMDEQWSFNITNPVVWSNTGTEPLQPYAPNGQLNMGVELTLGRTLDAGGLFPFISKTTLDSSTLADHWAPGSTSPLNNGQNLYQQALARIRAHILASGRPLGAIVWIQGEFDALDATKAANYQANLTAFVAQLRADLPGNWWFTFNQLNANLPTAVQPNGAPFRDTVRAGQAAFAASDTRSVMINVDDLPLDLDNGEGVGLYHYKSNALVSMGNRFGVAILSKLNPSALTPVAPVANAPFLLGYDQAAFGAGSVTPRWGGQRGYQAGDDGILVAISWATAGTISLTTPAGFTQIGTQVSSAFTGLTLTMSIYRCRATSNNMPAPTVTGPGAVTMAAIFIVRGGLASGNPVDVFSSGANNTFATAISIPGATTTGPNRFVMTMIGFETGAANSFSGVANASLSNLTTVRNVSQSINGNPIGIGLVTGVMAGTGAYGATTATAGGNSVNAGLTLALKAA
jgi:hypothetical protein